jgi:hypothetical protein
LVTKFLPIFEAIKPENFSRLFGSPGSTKEQLVLGHFEHHPAVYEFIKGLLFDRLIQPFDWRGCRRTWTNWTRFIFGERRCSARTQVSSRSLCPGFGADDDREGWIGFLDKAKQIFETYGDIPWVHWAPYEQTYLRRYAERFVMSEASLPGSREIFWTC